MLSLRKVLSVLALGMLALSASSVEAARMHHQHRPAQQVANTAQAAAAASGVTARAVLEEEFQAEFIKFIKANDKEYAVDDLFTRYNIFKDNYKFIIQQNAEADAGLHTHRTGVTWLADMTNEEYRNTMLKYQAGKGSPAPTMEEWESLRPAHWNLTAANIPNFMDWRQHHAVTSVKNQGQCGSCWSFGSTAAVESAHARHSGQLISLSEQQLVDCDNNNANGCSGGYVEGAYDYIKRAGGQASYEAYPYSARKGGCRGIVGGAKAKVSGYQRLPQDERAIVEAVANHGVLSVVLDGADPNFQHYHSGIMSTGCGTSLDHAIAIVGYGHDVPSGHDFWIMKNSWGSSSWGVGGYIYMQRGVNKCGMRAETAFPTV